MPKNSTTYQEMDWSVEAAALPARDLHYNDDDAVLRRLGKQPRLNRTFGFMSILGFSCSSLCSWESILLTSVPGLVIGGPAGLTWAVVVNWIGITSVYAVLGELASIAPTSGGQCKQASECLPILCIAESSNGLGFQIIGLTCWHQNDGRISCLI